MTAPFYVDDLVTLYAGDSLAMLRSGATLGYDFDLGYEPTRLVPDCSIDAVVTDPPYGIGFMGHEWDQPGQYGPLSAKHGGSNISFGGAPHPAMEAGRYDLSRPANVVFGEWCEAWARECLRVLKPGGHIIAFGGTRTWHRLACAVEDAGFELRDSMAWLFGSGFPKSQNIAKAITGTQLGHGANSGSIRRATMGGDYEPSGRLGNRDGAGRRDTGMLGRDLPLTPDGEKWDGWGTALKPAFEPMVLGRKPFRGTVSGNVLAHGTGGLHVDACRTAHDEPAGAARVGPGGSRSGGLMGTAGSERVRATDRADVAGRWPTNVLLDDVAAAELDAQTGVLHSGSMRAGTERQARAGGTIYGADARNFVPADTYGDSGGASRFFPTFRYEPKAPASERPRLPDGTAHPTVKPLDLMRWCVRLVTPPGGTVLDPFFGSGTTGEACVIEGFRCIGFERHGPYLRLAAEGRLGKPIARDIFGGVL